jgi:hypothetical protein
VESYRDFMDRWEIANEESGKAATAMLQDCDAAWKGVERVVFGGYLAFMASVPEGSKPGDILRPMLSLLEEIDGSVMMSFRGVPGNASAYLERIKSVSKGIRAVTSGIEDAFPLTVIAHVVLEVPWVWLGFHERMIMAAVVGKDAVGEDMSEEFLEGLLALHKSNVESREGLLEEKVLDGSSPCVGAAWEWIGKASKFVDDNMSLSASGGDAVIRAVEREIGAPWLEDPAEPKA